MEATLEHVRKSSEKVASNNADCKDKNLDLEKRLVTLTQKHVKAESNLKAKTTQYKTCQEKKRTAENDAKRCKDEVMQIEEENDKQMAKITQDVFKSYKEYKRMDAENEGYKTTIEQLQQANEALKLQLKSVAETEVQAKKYDLCKSKLRKCREDGKTVTQTEVRLKRCEGKDMLHTKAIKACEAKVNKLTVTNKELTKDKDRLEKDRKETADSKTKDQTIAELQKQLRATIDQLETRIEYEKSDNRDLAKKLKKVEAEKEALEKELQRSKKNIDSIKEAVANDVIKEGEMQIQKAMEEFEKTMKKVKKENKAKLTKCQDDVSQMRESIQDLHDQMKYSDRSSNKCEEKLATAREQLKTKKMEDDFLGNTLKQKEDAEENEKKVRTELKNCEFKIPHLVERALCKKQEEKIKKLQASSNSEELKMVEKDRDRFKQQVKRCGNQLAECTKQRQNFKVINQSITMIIIIKIIQHNTHLLNR